MTLQAGAPFAAEVLAAVGLGDLKHVMGLRIDVQDVTTVRLTVTQLVSREQGAAVLALMRRRRWLVQIEPDQIGEKIIGAEASDEDLDRTPTCRRAEG